MRVLVAGATGVIGRELVPLLAHTGHDVVALARGYDRAHVIDADVVAVDALDRVALTTVVRKVAPDAIVHLLTAIPQRLDPRRFGQQMALTNRLRSEATAHLVASAGGARLITQSIAFAYRPDGASIADEERPLWNDGPKPFRPVVSAVQRAERLTLEVAGTVLRFGHLYGPGTPYAADGSMVAQVRLGAMPLVGRGDGMFSFIHVRDAATAILAALEATRPGTFNVVDDDPAPARSWLPEMARLTAATTPRRVPKLAARLAAGSWGVAFMTALTGADNTRARRELQWRPSFPSWREGFASELTDRRASA